MATDENVELPNLCPLAEFPLESPPSSCVTCPRNLIWLDKEQFVLVQGVGNQLQTYVVVSNKCTFKASAILESKVTALAHSRLANNFLLILAITRRGHLRVWDCKTLIEGGSGALIHDSRSQWLGRSILDTFASESSTTFIAAGASLGPPIVCDLQIDVSYSSPDIKMFCNDVGGCETLETSVSAVRCSPMRAFSRALSNSMTLRCLGRSADFHSAAILGLRNGTVRISLQLQVGMRPTRAILLGWISTGEEKAVSVELLNSAILVLGDRGTVLLIDADLSMKMINSKMAMNCSSITPIISSSTFFDFAFCAIDSDARIYIAGLLHAKTNESDYEILKRKLPITSESGFSVMAHCGNLAAPDCNYAWIGCSSQQCFQLYKISISVLEDFLVSGTWTTDESAQSKLHGMIQKSEQLDLLLAQMPSLRSVTSSCDFVHPGISTTRKRSLQDDTNAPKPLWRHRLLANHDNPYKGANPVCTRQLPENGPSLVFFSVTPVTECCFEVIDKG